MAEETIIVEEGTVYKVIPPVPEVPATPAVPEQKVEVSKDDLLSDMSESRGRYTRASEELQRVQVQKVVLTSREAALQEKVDIELSKQADIQIALDSLPVDPEVEPLPDNNIEE
jgi:hypothetical protein